MSLKKDSTYLIKSLHEQIPENNISFFKEDTHKIFLQFFSYFQESVDYIKSSIDLKSHLIVDEEISSPKDVPKAANFDYIVKEIKEYIFTHVKHKIVFRFSNFLGREVSFYFSLTKNEKKEDIFNFYNIINRITIEFELTYPKLYKKYFGLCCETKWLLPKDECLQIILIDNTEDLIDFFVSKVLKN